MKVVIFEWVSLGGVDYYTAPKSEEDFSGEYVSLAECQALEEALERSYERCGQAMSKLETLLKRWNEIAPELILDSHTKRSVIEQLTQLIQDTQEVLK